MKDHQQSLPPYTYVPGKTPHPISDPNGHAYGTSDVSMTPEEAYKRGLHLFNHGYYWEAHEVWEHVWIALGRCGEAADHIKGLIKLAAAGVKCLEGNPRGATRHANRALELLSGPLRLTFEPKLDCNQLQEWARAIAATPPLVAEEELEACRSGGVPVLGQLTLTE